MCEALYTDPGEERHDAQLPGISYITLFLFINLQKFKLLVHLTLSHYRVN